MSHSLDRTNPRRMDAGRGASPLASESQPLLLRVMLQASGVSALGGGAVAAAFYGELRSDLVASLILGVALLAASGARPSHWRVVAAGYLTALFLLALLIGYYVTWAPAVIILLCYLVVAGGLLFGNIVLLPIAGLVALALAIAGLLVRAGIYSVPLIPELDPRIGLNWARTGCIFLILTSSAVWVLRSAMAYLTSTEAAIREADDEIRRWLREVDSARTARLRNEESLRDALKLQTVAQMGEGFAHLFNNLLTVVRCACAGARGAASEAAVREAGRSIIAGVQDAITRTRELLRLSHADKADPVPVRIDQELRRLQPRIASRLRGNLTLEFETEPVGVALLPPAWLEHIAMNLVLNAEQAMPDGGQVRVRTTRIRIDDFSPPTVDLLPAGIYVALVVADQGPGMREEVATRACEPFFSTKDRARHDGLGLTVVHDMARQLGGSLQILGGAPGATVTVLLPEHDGVAEPRPATVRPTSSDPDAAGKNPSRQAESGGALALPHRDVAAAVPARSHDPRGETTKPLTAAAGIPPELEESDWRSLAVARLLRASAAAFLVAVVAVASFVGVELAAFTLVLELAAIAVLLAGAYARRLSGGVRQKILLCVLLTVGVGTLARNTFLDFSGILLLALTAFLAAIFGGRWSASVVLLVGVLAHALGGTLWELGIIGSTLEPLTGDRSLNWFRMAVTLPLGLLVVGLAVLHVFQAGRRYLAELEAALRTLDEARRIHQTEIEKAESLEAIRARAMRLETAGRVTGMVAHDLNNSLQLMLSWAEVLVDLGLASTRIKAIAAVERAADYAQALIEQLRLHASAVHTGEGLDLGQEMARMRPLVEAIASRGMPLQLSLRLDTGCYVGINVNSLRRVVFNLVANARDAMESSGTCVVEVVNDGDRVRLVVSDDGLGMDDLTRGRLFEAFFTTKGERGTGLGLYSVAEIVRATGGLVEVWSEPGRGSRFTISWPVAQAPAEVDAPVVPERREGSRGRILIAEDNGPVREQLARGLQTVGYDVVVTGDADAALRSVDTEGPFVALCTDAVMPGTPVARLVERFAARYPRSPVVVISGYAPEEAASLVGLARNVTLLRKPFSYLELAEELSRMVRRDV